jgi:iron complex transport system substrate-binding protein
MIRRRTLATSALAACLARTAEAAIAVTDGLGRPIDLAAPPQRIVSLIGGAEAQLIALGVRTVGTNIVHRSYLARMQWLLGDGPAPAGVLNADMTPNAEAVLALAPDLIIAWAVENADLFGRHVPVYLMRHIRSLDGLRANLQALAALVGREALGATVLAGFNRRLAAYARVSPRSFTVAVVSQLGPRRFIIYTANALMTELLDHLGNARAAAPRSRRGMIEGDIETMHRLDADAIVLVSFVPMPRPEPPAALQGSRLWRTLRAVRDGRVVTVDGFEAVAFQSIPTAARLLDTVAPRLYPDIFPTALDDARIAAILGA